MRRVWPTLRCSPGGRCSHSTRRRAGRRRAWVAWVLLLGPAIGCRPAGPPGEATEDAPRPVAASEADFSIPPIPTCSEIPCAVPGADRPRPRDVEDRDEELRGRIVDERGEPVRARVAVHDSPVEVVVHDSPLEESTAAGAFVAVAGTRADGAFALRVPPWSPDHHVRFVVVESRGGFRVLSAADLPSGSAADIALWSVRALPLAINLPEVPREGMYVRMVVDDGDDGETHWAEHTLVRSGRLASRDLSDSSGGLLALRADGSILRATVLVPVGEVRVGVTVERRARSDLEGRNADAAAYGIAINDLALQVAPGAGPLGEQSLWVPAPDSAPLEIAGPNPPCLNRWSVYLRRLGGTGRWLDNEDRQALRRFAPTVRVSSVAPGTYTIGSEPECRQTFEVRPGRPQRVRPRRQCEVGCMTGHPVCGVRHDLPPGIAAP